MSLAFDAAAWQAANSQDLSMRLARVRSLLLRALGREAEPLEATPATTVAKEIPTTVSLLAATFDLSAFEVDILLLCAGIELDATIATLCSEMNGDPGRLTPTFGMALTVFPNAHWSALTPAAPLRRWHLINVADGGTLMRASLRIDERILHFLAGTGSLDSRFDGIIRLAPATAHYEGRWAENEVKRVTLLLDSNAPPIIALCGAERQTLIAAAEAAVAKHGGRLFLARAGDLPADPHERHTLARLWRREALLVGAFLLVETDGDPAALKAFGAFAAEEPFPVFLAGEVPVQIPTARRVVRVLFDRASSSDQHDAWQRELESRSIYLNGYVPTLTAQFQLPPVLIRAAVDDALAGLAPDASQGELKQQLWESCRRQARPALDDLAQRIETRHTWDDLVLPQAQSRMLREVVAHVAQRRQVYETWGFGAHVRGTGTSVIFAGGSGVGKTLAAEIIANVLHLDLYRIDLSGVVSKYIGETEKNLRRIFTAAEYGGAILLFDEADALFGKRSEVRDSHDRYANIEVSFLLQQTESYRGLAILTTNMLDNLDRAFLRRIRFILQFPFPTAEQRSQIWARVFPPEAPTEALDISKLARLNVTGGSIRNIALNGAFLAAEEGDPIRMRHLLRAAAGEYAKLEKPLPDSEVGDWVCDDA